MKTNLFLLFFYGLCSVVMSQTPQDVIVTDEVIALPYNEEALVQPEADTATMTLRALAVQSKVWKTNTINVCWENASVYDTTKTRWVKEAVTKTWAAEANVIFVGWKACSPTSRGIRIQIADVGPNSLIGTDLDGKMNGMKLNFTFNNWCKDCVTAHGIENAIKFVAVHEFGHALGFTHENRPTCECALNEKTETKGDLILTACDAHSIMNYCNDNWNNHGQLSPLDKEGVKKLYGKKTSVVTTAAPQPFVISFSNTLGDNQSAESLTLELEGVKVDFILDKSTTTVNKKFKVAKEGYYSYKITSDTFYGRVPYKGVGAGRVYLKPGLSYYFAATDIVDGVLKISVKNQ